MRNITARYELNKNSIIGDECICPSCGTKFTKVTKQQAFCKSKGKTKCKDKYWNNVTPHKRNNTTRISPASARYMANKARENNYKRYECDHIFSSEALGQW